MKIVKTYRLNNAIFTAVKDRCILHGRVFVMTDMHNLISMFVVYCQDSYIAQVFKPLAYIVILSFQKKPRRDVFS